MQYTVKDIDEYRRVVERGDHAGIIAQCMTLARNKFGPGARYLSTTVDGELQPD